MPSRSRDVLSGGERYNIYCAPCHSRVGDGNGFIPSRGFARKTPSYHTERLGESAGGHIYGVMTEGFAPCRITRPRFHRGSLASWLHRALQLSQHATVADAQGYPIRRPRRSWLSWNRATLPRVKPGVPSTRNAPSTTHLTNLDLGPASRQDDAWRALVVGVIARCGGTGFSNPTVFFRGYLVSYMDWLCVCLGRPPFSSSGT
jgi:hypothetical protein